MPRLVQTRPLDDDQITIACLYCNRPQKAGRRALSIPCRFCSRSLCLENLVFSSFVARRAVETCGIVIIEEKGDVLADRIVCGTLIVRGKLKAAAICSGVVTLEAHADFRGSLLTPRLIIVPGARLDADCRVNLDH